METSPAVDTSPQTPPSRPPAAGLAGRLRAHGWLAAALLALVLSRALLIQSDPTDFPLDRNMTAGFHVTRFLRITAWHPDTLTPENLRRLVMRYPDAPEFPLLPVAARLLAVTGIPPLVAPRIISLLMSLWTGVGVYILGCRMHSRRAGGAALGLFALLPFSIFMGRSLLPDVTMTALVTWSLVAAGAPGAAPGRRLRRTTLWLALAALAKLPALFFAPAAAALMMQRLGWRRPASWLRLAVCALIVGGIACAWYGIAPWHPLADLHRISAGTNQLLASPAEVASARGLWISAMRLVLALTLPGVALALVGWGILQKLPDRLPFNAWILLALLFVAISVRANTYWAYAALPAGCLLGGLALAEMARRWPRALAPLALALMAALAFCPGTARVREYLEVHPEYNALQAEARKVISDDVMDHVYYLGRTAGDLQFFIRHRGFNGTDATTQTVLAELARKPYPYLASNRMVDNPAVDALFTLKPILAARPQQFVIFGTAPQATLGEAVAPTDTSPPLTLDLSGGLRIAAMNAPARRLPPGGTLELAVTFERGPRPVPSPNLTLELVHQPSGAAFPLAAARAGLFMTDWARPLLQTPDFDGSPRRRMRYEFPLSANLPAGPYTLRFALLADRRRPALAGPWQSPPLRLEILPPPLEAPPLRLRPEEGFWLNPVLVTGQNWLGTTRREAILTSFGQLWLRPALPAGEYRLAITARGIAVGPAPDERWPVLRVRQPGRESAPLEIPFDSAAARTINIPLAWRGPEDCLHFSIANPATATVPRGRFTLNLEDFDRDRRQVNRSIIIERLVIREADS